MSRLNPNRSMLLAAGLCLLAACGQSPDEAKTGGSVSARPVAAPASDGDWVMAVRSSGVELPVFLRFELAQRPGVGTAFPVRLRLESPEPVEGLSLRLELPEGLAAVGPPLSLKNPRLAAGGKLDQALSLKAGREGMFEVRINLSLAASPGKEQSAVFSIPVIVGGP